MLECWKAVYRGARVGPGDRVFFPFSFGPFLGFWAGFEAGLQIGLHCIPAAACRADPAGDDRGGRRDGRVLHADVCACGSPRSPRSERPAGRWLRGPVRMLIVAGEPGGSIPATRERIERSWGARVIDHHGLTEVGPGQLRVLGGRRGLCTSMRRSSSAEVLDPATGARGRRWRSRANSSSPISAVPPAPSSATALATSSSGARSRARADARWARLEGGILSRADDMVNIRGVNVYPVGIESVVRRFAEVVEFRSVVSRPGAMRSLRLEIEVAPEFEDSNAVASRVAYRPARGARADSVQCKSSNRGRCRASR